MTEAVKPQRGCTLFTPGRLLNGSVSPNKLRQKLDVNLRNFQTFKKRVQLAGLLMEGTSNIRAVLGSQNSRYSKASAKARAVGQFFKYLDWQYAIVWKRDIHTEEATSGASYVLNKIDACLKFYFTKEVMSSDDSDILAF